MLISEGLVCESSHASMQRMLPVAIAMEVSAAP
jgi:hypothetical protein